MPGGVDSGSWSCDAALPRRSPIGPSRRQLVLIALFLPTSLPVHTSSSVAPSYPLAFLASGPACRRALEQTPRGCVLPPAGALTLRFLVSPRPPSHTSVLSSAAFTSLDQPLLRDAASFSTNGAFPASRPSDTGPVCLQQGNCLNYSPAGVTAGSSQWAFSMLVVHSTSLSATQNVTKSVVPPLPPSPFAARSMAFAPANRYRSRHAWDATPGEGETRLQQCTNFCIETGAGDVSYSDRPTSASLQALTNVLWWIQSSGLVVSLTLAHYTSEEIQHVAGILNAPLHSEVASSCSLQKTENMVDGTPTGALSTTGTHISELHLCGQRLQNISSVLLQCPLISSLALRNTCVTGSDLRHLSKQCQNITQLTLSMNTCLTSTKFLNRSPSTTIPSSTTSSTPGGHWESPVDSRDVSQWLEDKESDGRQPTFVVRLPDVDLGQVGIATHHTVHAQVISEDSDVTTSAMERRCYVSFPPPSLSVRQRLPIQCGVKRQISRAPRPARGRHLHWSKTMRYLNLSYTSICNNDAASDIPRLARLQYLSLEGCRYLTCIDWVPLLTQLRELDLSFTNIPATSLHVLQHCPCLAILRLDRCPMMSDVSMLLKAHNYPAAADSRRDLSYEGNGLLERRMLPATPVSQRFGMSVVRRKLGASVIAHTLVSPAVARLEEASHRGAPVPPTIDADLASLPLCASLQQLYLDETSITSDGLSAVALFQQLHTLSLRGCRSLRDISVLTKLPLLSFIDVSQTGIRSEGVDALRHSLRLQRVRMRDCSGLTRIPAFTSSLRSSLLELDLSDCRGLLASGMDIDCFNPNTGEGDDDSIAPHPSDFSSSLQFLSLRSCHELNDIAGIQSLKDLKKLDLYHTRVTGEALVNALSQCRCLEVLNIASTAVENDALAAWSGNRLLDSGDETRRSVRTLPPLFLRTLRHLDVSNTAIASIGLSFLSLCHHLEVLLLRHCPSITSLSFLRLDLLWCPVDQSGEGGSAHPPRQSLRELVVTDAVGLANSECVPYVACCTGLVKLSLIRCPRVVDVNALCCLHQLQELDLSGTGVAREGLQHLAPRESLVHPRSHLVSPMHASYLDSVSRVREGCAALRKVWLQFCPAVAPVDIRVTFPETVEVHTGGTCSPMKFRAV